MGGRPDGLLSRRILADEPGEASVICPNQQPREKTLFVYKSKD